MTLGNAAAARIRLIVWCRTCSHQIEPNVAEMAARHGAEPRRSGLGRVARLFGLREPLYRHCGERDGATLISSEPDGLWFDRGKHDQPMG